MEALPVEVLDLGGEISEVESDGMPSPGQDLSREDRVVLSGGEEEDAPPCPEEDPGPEDEWADDNDAGYLLEPITEQEFLEIEERFAKIFAVYREDSVLSVTGEGGISPAGKLMQDLSLEDEHPEPGTNASEAVGSKKKRRNHKSAKQALEDSVLSATGEGGISPAGKLMQDLSLEDEHPEPGTNASEAVGSKKKRKNRKPTKKALEMNNFAMINGAQDYEGMEQDLAEVELDYKDDGIDSAPVGKKRRKKKRNKRRKSEATAENTGEENNMPVTPPASPVIFPKEALVTSVPMPPTPPSSPNQKLDSKKKQKKSRNGKNVAHTTAVSCEQETTILTPPNSPVVADKAPENGDVAPQTPPSSPVGFSGQKSRSRKKKKRESGIGAGLDGGGLQTPEVGGNRVAHESSGGIKSSNKKKKPNTKSVERKLVSTSAELTKGSFVESLSPHLTSRSSGSVGNIGFSSGETPSTERPDYLRSDVWGQKKYRGVDGDHYYFDLKVIFNPFRTGFEEEKDFNPPPGSVVVGRYEVCETLGQAAFSTAYQCLDLESKSDEHPWVCLKVIKNSKDFFDQSLDEIKLLQYINSKGDPHKNNVLRMIDFFYCKEHLFIVSELLRENLYDFGKFIRDSGAEPYFTLSRLKKIMLQVLEALVYIHSLGLIHCDIKPENIVIKSYSRCEVKLIDFGSSCFVTDHLTTYIQSRSYRAPEVILGIPYDFRIDIWSLGGVLAEMFTGYVLFQNDSIATMLARITGILGPLPEVLMQNLAECSKYFVGGSNIVYECNDDGYFIVHPKKSNFRQRLHIYSEPSEIGNSQDDLFVDFVTRMLDLDPYRRWNAAEALTHPWLQDAHEVDVTYSSNA